MEHKLDADFTIYGIELDEPYEGPSVSIAACPVEDGDEVHTNCICIKYHIQVGSDDVTLAQDDVNRMIMEEVDPFLHCFSLLLGVPSQLLCSKTRLDENSVELELSPHDVPIGLHDLAARWDRQPSSAIRSYSSLVPRDSWPLLETMMSEYRRRPIEMRRQLAIPLRWFTKASNEMSSLDRLVAYWISFNSLYQDSTKKEHEAIGACLQANLDTFIADRYVRSNGELLHSLSRLPITLGRGKCKRLIAQELGTLLGVEPKDSVSVVRPVAMVIYGIRNNVFHGDYDPNAHIEQQHAEVAEHLLSPLLKEIIAYRIMGRPLSTIRFATRHKLTF